MCGERLAGSEALGRPRDEVRADLPSYLCGRHVIFFRRRGRMVEVIRILHGRQSPEKVFGG